MFALNLYTHPTLFEQDLTFEQWVTRMRECEVSSELLFFLTGIKDCLPNASALYRQICIFASDRREYLQELTNTLFECKKSNQTLENKIVNLEQELLNNRRPIPSQIICQSVEHEGYKLQAQKLNRRIRNLIKNDSKAKAKHKKTVDTLLKRRQETLAKLKVSEGVAGAEKAKNAQIVRNCVAHCREIDTLKSEVHSLREELAGLKAVNKDIAEENANLTKRLRETECDKNTLDKELAKFADCQKELAEMKSRYEAIKSEFRTSKIERDATVNSLKAELEKTQKAVEQYKMMAATTKKELTNKQLEFQRFKSSYDNMAKDLKQLRNAGKVDALGCTQTTENASTSIDSISNGPKSVVSTPNDSKTLLDDPKEAAHLKNLVEHLLMAIEEKEVDITSLRRINQSLWKKWDQLSSECSISKQCKIDQLSQRNQNHKAEINQLKEEKKTADLIWKNRLARINVCTKDRVINLQKRNNKLARDKRHNNIAIHILRVKLSGGINQLIRRKVAHLLRQQKVRQWTKLHKSSIQSNGLHS